MGSLSDFRILDLGSHDGYISNWLGRQLKAKGLDVRIDGIELNPEAVDIARKRHVRDDIAGDFRVGLAEDAAKQGNFPKARYDAVVAFELIEHVPDVRHFLEVAESMCKPGGRLYLSTPDGTFGEGQNPHHLRVYRAIDLADLARRRGEMEGMIVGGDGVSVLCYSPYEAITAAERESGDLDVAIFAGGGIQPWTPIDIELKGLGGSETAAVRLGEAIADLGYVVTVYGEIEPQGPMGQVLFKHWTSFDPMDNRKAVIYSRIPEALERRTNADRVFYWMHDTDYGPRLTEELASHADAILVLSEWHREHVLGMYPFTKEKLIVTRNGITPEYYAGYEMERHRNKAVYSSSPDRGLDLLLEWWPEVRERVPDAELHYCYADVYQAAAKLDPRLARFRDRVDRLGKQDGVLNLGSLSQPQLARLLRSAGVWLHPSYFSPAEEQFYETYCIGAIEAAAAGCRIVCSDWGALPERANDVQTHVDLVPATDGRPDKNRFIDSIVLALTEGYPDPPTDAARALSWKGVANQVVELMGTEHRARSLVTA